MASPTTCPECGAALGPSRVRGEGPWNQQWREGLPEDRQFVPHDELEADVVCPDGMVVELQYGTLARLHIVQRERIYGNMVWLFHACEAHSKGRLRLTFAPGRPHVNFAWRSPRETLDACRRPVFLDVGESDQQHGRHLILQIKRRYPRPGHLLGSGLVYTAEAFHNWMAHGIPLTPYIPETTGNAAA